MAFVPVGECYRVALEFDSLGGETAANVLYVKDELGTPTTVRCEDLYDEIVAWANTDWDVVACSQWTLRTINVRSVDTEFAPYHSDSPAIPGAVVQAPMPAQDTVAITLQTGLTGRSFRGRLYHVGLTEADITDGRLTPTTITAYTQCYENLKTALGLEDYTWVVVSYVADGVPRASGLATPISSIAIRDNKVDRQVRRKG